MRQQKVILNMFMKKNALLQEYLFTVLTKNDEC